MKELLNQVEVKALAVEADFNEAQRILDINEYTEEIDAECAYEYRVDDTFVGTYLAKVDRQDEYERFVDMLINHQRMEEKNMLSDIVKQYNSKEIEWEEFEEKRWELINSNKMTAFRVPTYEEWKTNKYQVDEKRQMKLGKAMQKNGIPSEVVEFYSQQVKSDKEYAFVVSDLPQHIVGMSYYAKPKSWSGYMGTSCMDVRHGGKYPRKLAGALHDDKLYVGMLLAKESDLQDMEHKLLARVLFRLVEIEGENTLIATRYYGNNATKDVMDKVIRQLGQFDIYGEYIQEDGKEVTEEANGAYEMEAMTTAYTYIEIEQEVEITCPACGGDGLYYALTEDEQEVEVDCPICGGSGTYETTVSIDEEHEVEVEKTIEIRPYFDDENYYHWGHEIEIMVNLDKVAEIRQMVIDGREKEVEEVEEVDEAGKIRANIMKKYL